jgi:hypothetical protein
MGSALNDALYQQNGCELIIIYPIIVSAKKLSGSRVTSANEEDVELLLSHGRDIPKIRKLRRAKPVTTTIDRPATTSRYLQLTA